MNEKQVGITALVAALIWIVVRFIKDPAIPIPLPPRARPLLAIGLGAAAGAIESMTGEPIGPAMLRGLMAGLLAIGSHELGEATSGAREKLSGAQVPPQDEEK